MLDSCASIRTSDNLYNVLTHNFIRHYEQNRYRYRNKAICIDISQYRLLLGPFCYTRTVFRLNCLTVQPSYEGRVAAEGVK
jgi:hypothetical protein